MSLYFLYFLYFLNQANALKTGSICNYKNSKARVCENLIIMPKIVSEALKTQIVQNSNKDVTTDIDYKVSIEKLKKFLSQSSLMEDEKTWNDRPIKNVKGTLNSVEAALNELQEFEKSSGIPINKAEANAILDRYFDQIDSEVFPIPLILTYTLGISNFSAEPGSILDLALQKLEFSSVNLTEWSKMATVALSELLSLIKSIGSETQRSKIKFKVYSEREVFSFINETFDYLSNESTENLKSQVFDRNFDWNQSLRRSSSTIIPLPFDAIVPGGRFTEVYYWDSYWVVRGLASAGKLDLMMNQVKNYFYLIDTYGFVPNGARTYYLDRSQPPLLGEMVMIIVEYLSNHGYNIQKREFILQALPRLLTEYLGFWMNPLTNHIVDVSTGTHSNPTPQASNTREVIFQIINKNIKYLNRYHSFVTDPRPESYLTDVERQVKFIRANYADSTNKLMQDIRAAAESGWDFSSRWNRRYVEGQFLSDNKTFFNNIDTTNILPCDLNSILYASEKAIARLLNILHEDLSILDENSIASNSIASIFTNLHKKRSETILAYMGVKSKTGSISSIVDFDFKSKTTSKVVSAALIMSSRNLGLEFQLPGQLIGSGGVHATLIQTGEQWDRPNAWPPNQIYFESSRYFWNATQNSDNLQNDFFYSGSSNFLASVKMSFTSLFKQNSTKGYFYEKYNANVPGLGGSGGEYINQVGFGWTNGVVIELFSRFCSVKNIETLEGRIKSFYK